ncbi:MAG: hypothetical protein GX580_16050 [Candidatus Hydrogenedens sp.]|nr:hypothetical protein [Candidatus Hydrogenedentota bacterium]NLF59142.1 hypothetical protein [Candidatus Hydrogenedens sp.]
MRTEATETLTEKKEKAMNAVAEIIHGFMRDLAEALASVPDVLAGLLGGVNGR